MERWNGGTVERWNGGTVKRNNERRRVNSVRAPFSFEISRRIVVFASRFIESSRISFIADRFFSGRAFHRSTVSQKKSLPKKNLFLFCFAEKGGTCLAPLFIVS
ncbi:MAG TPA: hypothetical protein VH559_10950 [Gemmatimonadaceae bacterium]